MQTSSSSAETSTSGQPASSDSDAIPTRRMMLLVDVDDEAEPRGHAPHDETRILDERDRRHRVAGVQRAAGAAHAALEIEARALAPEHEADVRVRVVVADALEQLRLEGLVA